MNHFYSRACTLLAILMLALIPAAAAPQHVADGVQSIEVHAQSIDAFDPREPSKTRFGRLTFRGGLVLDSSFRDFGGLSALRVFADGEHFLSLSDRGVWLRGRIVYGHGVPIAIADAEMAPMLGADGRTLKSRGWFDSESLAIDGGTVWIGIERVQQVVRFDYGKDGLRAGGVPIAVPPGMKLLPRNQSIECLVAVPKADGPLGGMLISVSERGLDTHGNLMSFLIGGQNSKSQDSKNQDSKSQDSKSQDSMAGGSVFSLRRTDDFDVSDCALTPDHQLLVLERRFSWTRGLAIRIRSVPLASIKPGALVDGPELIYADMGYQIDNMEGLSVHVDASGRQVLTLISDDNFSPLQRTLLLQFTLD